MLDGQSIGLKHIQEALIVIRIIEETIALNDPYNNPFPNHEEYEPELSDCDFPDFILDPLLLVRVTLGDEHASDLEYEGDLRHIADTIQQCVDRELNFLGKAAFDIEGEGSSGEADPDVDEGTAGGVASC